MIGCMDVNEANKVEKVKKEVYMARTVYPERDIFLMFSNPFSTLLTDLLLLTACLIPSYIESVNLFLDMMKKHVKN